MSGTPFANLDALAVHLREELENKKFILLYAYNGTGKTRLSMAFKNLGRQGDERDTLYFNAFTEDLFTWDNDLDSDSERVLKINSSSRFFAGIEELEMENRIRPFLHRYGDFDFSINYEQWTISFSREIQVETNEGLQSQVINNIKVSRGEENIFIWCFFLAIVQLAVDGAEAYNWVKYIFIDDPISSLDDNNVIAVASHLAQLLKRQDRVKAIISSHHTLFFNVLCNELDKANKYFLSKNQRSRMSMYCVILALLLSFIMSPHSVNCIKRRKVASFTPIISTYSAISLKKQPAFTAFPISPPVSNKKT